MRAIVHGLEKIFALCTQYFVLLFTIFQPDIYHPELDRMNETIASWLVSALGIYLAIGLVFSIPFVLKGVGKNDPAVKGSSVGFRLIIIPGVVLLWPVLLRRWMSNTGVPPEEASPHRAAAK